MWNLFGVYDFALLHFIHIRVRVHTRAALPESDVCYRVRVCVRVMRACVLFAYLCVYAYIWYETK